MGREGKVYGSMPNRKWVDEQRNAFLQNFSNNKNMSEVTLEGSSPASFRNSFSSGSLHRLHDPLFESHLSFFNARWNIPLWCVSFIHENLVYRCMRPMVIAMLRDIHFEQEKSDKSFVTWRQFGAK
ncbi:hypothetical protein CEXT_140341 [Caerostris extrusa]|uniref:Uncharacterized protein n=1 Tax=Caerostris extrusa TaxID=172846 RepID=A0AAV4XNH5_CAEEX|nr:hypothetical protein CEXT_140341 [Caerostris extrusa]